MTDRDPMFVLNGATSQFDRLRGAPTPDQVEVDGRSLAQIIAFAARYGALIAFYDLENRIAGDWGDFFAADPSVADALRAGLDLVDIEHNLHALLDEMRVATDLGRRTALLRRLAHALIRLVAILDGRHRHADDPETLLDFAAAGARGDRLDDPLDRLRGHVGSGPLDLAVARGHAHGGRWWTELCDHIDDLVSSLIAELRHRAADAEARLHASLHEPGHAPQAALYNGFAVLFAEARRTLNHFPERLVRFYFDRILGQSTLDPVPDQLFLTFTRKPDVTQASVPRGALFPAGTDADGRPINYRAESAIEVTPATVAEVSLHRVVERSHGGLLVSTGVLSGMVSIPPEQSGAPTPFPMFGTDRPGFSGALAMAPATLGFCVASPLLLMMGGTRTVDIAITISLGAAGRGDRAEPPDAALLNAMSQAIAIDLTLHYSTAGGWVPVDGFEVVATPRPDLTGAVFAITFTLPPDAPAMQPLGATPRACTPPPPLPPNAFPSPTDQSVLAFNVAIDPQERPLAYSLLSLLWFEGITLDVEVSGLDQLSLMTPKGLADTSQDFAPLGLPPSQGASLEISAPELFVKPLDTLSVAIDWVGLPVTSGGFEGYYRDYVIDADGHIARGPLFDNRSFQVTFATVNPSYWSSDPATSCYLFQTGPAAITPPPTPDPSRPVMPDASAPLAPSSILQVPVWATRGPPPYYDGKTSALKMTLVAPSYAFGNILFSNNLMYASQKAIPVPTPSGSPRATPPVTPATIQPVILPNPPWLPMASGLRVHYRSSSTLRLDTSAGDLPTPSGSALGPDEHNLLKVWHIAPFDVLQPAVDDNGDDARLLPHIDRHAALYIQLSAPASPVSLLFILSSGPDGWWDVPPTIVWEERVDHRWKPCTVLDDSTNGFKNSGIVTLAPTIAPNASKAPRLRARAKGSTRSAPIVESVTTNALTARWAGPGGASGLGTPVPAGTITKSVASLDGVASITQPMQSFGGAPPGVGRDFDTWMAERLRHKGYAIDGWDYARLALQAAPSLWQVAVVAATDADTGRRAPGKVWVVLVAGPATPNVADPTIPQVVPSTLSSIGEMLQAQSSPFLEIAVTNPPYRRITVRADIEFDQENSGSFWTETLESDLIEWLSPWPSPRFPARPHDYYTDRAVAEFVRHRPYVRAILHLDLRTTPDISGHGYCYFTSALSHDIKAVPLRGATTRGGE